MTSSDGLATNVGATDTVMGVCKGSGVILTLGECGLGGDGCGVVDVDVTDVVDAALFDVRAFRQVQER